MTDEIDIEKQSEKFEKVCHNSVTVCIISEENLKATDNSRKDKVSLYPAK
jgi:hypothetical protein